MNDALTRTLAMYNQYRLQPGCCLDQHPMEIGYIEAIRQEVAPLIPTDANYQDYEDLLNNGPGQHDPLHVWLADHATKQQMLWFLQQEAAGEAGFADLLAMTQVKMPVQAKMEMARNFWDEMGNGKPAGMHDKLLSGVVEHFGVKPSVETTVEEALLLVNLMIGLAFHRRYAWQALGALGVIEMTAPGRVALVDKGLKRLGVPKQVRLYFTLHATLDIKHSRDWNREAIQPFSAMPQMQAILEGAYLRLWAGQRTYERYRRELGV